MTNQKLQELIFKDYDKNEMPFGKFEWNKPVAVDVEITIQAIPNIQQEKAYFEVDLWFSQIWNDPSLQFQHLDDCKLNVSLDSRYFSWA